jgi:uncharacterized protein
MMNSAPHKPILSKNYLIVILLLIALWLFFDVIAWFLVEVLWFDKLGYLSVFLLQLKTKILLFTTVFSISLIYLIKNFAIAQKLKNPYSLPDEPGRKKRGIFTYPVKKVFVDNDLSKIKLFLPLDFRLFFPIVLGLSALCGGIFFYYCRVFLIAFNLNNISSHTNSNILSNIATNIFNNTSESIPLILKTGIIFRSFLQIFSNPWLIGLLAIFMLVILVYSHFILRTVALLLTVFISTTVTCQWDTVLQSFQPTLFNNKDPLFNQDIRFYIFSLPIWEIVEFWLMGLFLLGFIIVSLSYLLYGNNLSEGRFLGFSKPQLRHLSGVSGALMFVIGLSYWLSRYRLLYSPRGVSYGASYTDIVAQLPVNTILSLSAFAIAGYLLIKTIFWSKNWSIQIILYKFVSQFKSNSRWNFLSKSFLANKVIPYGLGLYPVIAILIYSVFPMIIQYIIVQPNELFLEQPYIEKTIEFTRQAFALDKIDTIAFEPKGQLTEADLKENDLSIRNIRLWDERPLLETNRQLQQIRLYYRFADADIDRYQFVRDNPIENNRINSSVNNSSVNNSSVNNSSVDNQLKNTSSKNNSSANTSAQQVLIAARELDYSAVPKQAQTWINRSLIYTHGYGFTLSPVNRVAAGGLPEYYVKDIGVTEGTPLTTSNETVRKSIPIGEPRIYYGEITNTHVMTGTKVKELDYPSGNDNAYNIYDGRGGINIASLWRRLIFAKYFKDWRIIVSPELKPETKILFRRNINQRIRAIAPFLHFDSDPYLVAADTGNPSTDPSHLYWIIDGYTISNRYPYADIGNEGINYIRNSVKVIIDAYHGTVDFYITDTQDPIIKTWSTIFPNLFKPLDTMPVNLRSHLRYPVDLFKIQSERLMTYHMTDTQVFYNREDQWQIPNEVYGDKSQPVEPYHLITSLPNVPFEEFVLLLPYTPKQRTNLIAWLAARSDGNNYGKLLLYEFPKQRLVYGTEQIEARINQDPEISQQISLWNRQGSRVIQGNLLVIPIKESLLYVEPLYLEATENKLPTLVRVIVAYENKIVMAESLDEALKAIFKQGKTVAPIIRPVE